MFQRHRTAVLYAVYSLTCLIFLSWSADYFVRTLKHTVYYLLEPVSAPFLSRMDQWGAFGTNMSRLIRADRRDRSYQTRWIDQRFDEARFAALEAENQRLTHLLALSRVPRFRAVGGRVWTRDPTDWFHSVLVRPASTEGLSVSNPVVAEVDQRLVVFGQVIDVLPDGFLRVLLVTDALSTISAHVAGTREQGIVEGRNTNRCVMNYLFSDSPIKVGDEILTSGLGQVFPENLLIGRVVSVQEASRGNFKRATLLPGLPLDRLNDVLILVPVAPDATPMKKPEGRG